MAPMGPQRRQPARYGAFRFIHCRMEDAEKEVAAFRLSFSESLSGPVRCVAVDDDSTFVAATADGSARVYKRNGSGSAFDGASLLNGQRLHGLKPGLLFALCNYKEGSFISGGSDSKALVFNIYGERLAQLVGKHHKSVNSVARARNGDIITGSHDGYSLILYTFQPISNLSIRVARPSSGVRASFCNT